MITIILSRNQQCPVPLRSIFFIYDLHLTQVDEDFLAAYQANYGVNTNEQSVKSYYEQYAAQLAAEQPKLAKADSDSEEDEDDDDDDDDENPEGSKKRSGGRDKSSHTQKETAEEQKPKAGQKRKVQEGTVPISYSCDQLYVNKFIK